MITTILIEDIEKDRFSIVNFYERRIRRLLPPLFVVMFVCIPFAWMWMQPWQMNHFSQSLVAVSLFISNFLFWDQSGYFDTVAEEKPLLHTWSLAVEEQYYLFFPVFLLLAWRFGKNHVVISIIVIAVGSLLLSEYAGRRNPSANFYFTFTRAWELLSGSIAAFAVHKRGIQDNNILSLLGLGAVIFTIFAYDKNTPIPGVYALITVVGVVLMVLYAGKNTITAKLLSIKLFVGIGLISYSAYLWHQPFFAFARIVNIQHPSLALMIALALLSFVFAWITWRFVEKPFRNRNLVSRKYIFCLALVGTGFFTVIGLIGDKFDGFERVPEQITTEAITNSNFIILGDSHAGHLVSGIKQITNGKVIEMTGPGCIPFRNVDRYDSRFEEGYCAEIMNGFLDQLVTITDNVTVIISSMGPVYLDGTAFMGQDLARTKGNEIKLIHDNQITDHYEIFEIGMRNTMIELLENDNLDVVYTIDVPELGINHGCNIREKSIEIFNFKITDFTKNISLDPSKCRLQRKLYDKRVKAYKELVFRVLNDFPEVTLFDPTDYFCDEIYCNGYIGSYGYLYRDPDHLSEFGSLYFAKQFGSYLSQNRSSFNLKIYD